MSGAGELIEALEVTEPLGAALMREAVAAFAPPPGSRGLDVGCGIGIQTVRLAAAAGTRGHVTAFDLSEEVLVRTAERVAAAGLGERVDLVTGDMAAMPFADDSFDWLWSSDCLGYPCGDPLPALREAVRVVRPGGRVAILAWTSQHLLPGHALLEARLNATCSTYAPYLEGAPGETQFLRAPAWFAAAGLTEAAGRTFVGEVRAPLDEPTRAALAALFAMLWDADGPGLATADAAELRRLCRPGSADFVADLPGYYGFFTYTMFSAEVAAG
jgi:SAM-dependent methyltransferase